MKATATILSEIASALADNGSRQISPQDNRDRLNDIVGWLTYLEGLRTITATGHGMTSADVGKPIGWQSGGAPVVWDDAANPQTEYPTAILGEVVDVNTIRVAAAGEILDIADTLLPAGMPNPGGLTNYRMPFWDKSAGTYKSTKPADSKLEIQLIYYVRAGGAGRALVQVLAPTAPTETPVA